MFKLHESNVLLNNNTSLVVLKKNKRTKMDLLKLQKHIKEEYRHVISIITMDLYHSKIQIWPDVKMIGA